MDMKDIITKEKKEFLLYEMPHFCKRSINAFKKYMKGMEATCKNCGVYYWKECQKRCKCE